MDNDKRKIIEDNPVNNKGSKSKRKRVKKTKTAKFNPSRDGSKKNLVIIGISVLVVIFISALIFNTLTTLFSTETYYVLNANVKSKERITPELLAVRETAQGTGPINALTMEEIQRGDIYAKYPLYAGDVIAASNTGPLSGQALGIPDDWSETSFSINSTDAVGGILGRGDYIDILGVDEDGARYIFNNLLILDVKFVNEAYDTNETGQTIVGELMHYKVGLPAKEVAYLHSALADYTNFKIIKSPYILNYAKRDVSDLDKVFKYGPEVGNIDLFLGTDPTFTPIERDETGKPIKTINPEEVDEREDIKVPEPVIEETKEKIDSNLNKDNLNTPTNEKIEEIEVEEVENKQGN